MIPKRCAKRTGVQTERLGADGTLEPMTKTELHQLVDALPEESWEAAASLLRRARDPVVAKLDAAPIDDEPLTEEDEQAVREALNDPGIPWSKAEEELHSE
jgi:hypothetical protein